MELQNSAILFITAGVQGSCLRRRGEECLTAYTAQLPRLTHHPLSESNKLWCSGAGAALPRLDKENRFLLCYQHECIFTFLILLWCEC